MTTRLPGEDPVVATCAGCGRKYTASEFPKLGGCRFEHNVDSGKLYEYRRCVCEREVRASKGEL